jgi:hypothetical protein
MEDALPVPGEGCLPTFASRAQRTGVWLSANSDAQGERAIRIRLPQDLMCMYYLCSTRKQSAAEEGEDCGVQIVRR